MAAEDSTAAAGVGFMEAVEGFMGLEVSTPEATLGMAAGTSTTDIAAATTEVGATTEDVALTAGATAGAEDIGAEDTVMDGAGVVASGGRIGVGDIRMATTTTLGITRPTLIILIRIRVLTMASTILPRQILTHGPSLPNRKAQPMRTTQITTSRRLHRVGRLFPLTG